MTDTLATIVAHKRDLYAARKAQLALHDVEAAAREADAPRGFIRALHAAHADEFDEIEALRRREQIRSRSPSGSRNLRSSEKSPMGSWPSPSYPA